MRRLPLTVVLLAVMTLAAIPVCATAGGSPKRSLLAYVPAPVVVGPVGASLGVCATDLRGHDFRLTDPRYDGLGSWSPDGSLIAFAGPADPPAEDHAVDLFVADPQGRNIRDLTRGGGRGNLGEVFGWSPDGSELGGNWSGLGSSVFLAKTGETGLRLLASTNYGEYVFGQSWSPDGSRILLSRSGFANMVPAISVIDVDGSNERKLLEAADDASWSPDGQQVAYYAYPHWPLATGLGVAQADGSNAHLLVQGANFTGRPTWSPDGSLLAYVESGNLGVVQANGGGVRLLANGVIGSPQWSPDGSLIAFTRGTDEASRVALIKPDGSGEQDLAAGSDPVWRVPAQLPSNRRPCIVRGTRRADVIRGTSRGDVIFGGAGNDRMYGGGGGDILLGGPGRDRIYGDSAYGNGKDFLVGGSGQDRLYGRGGNDFLVAKDRSRDFVYGGPGRDTAWDDGRDVESSIEYFWPQGQ